MKTAVVLLSGGLDSTTVLAIAQSQHRKCHTLSIDYGQRHRQEIEAARQVAKEAGVASHRNVCVALDVIGGSALTDNAIAVPTLRTQEEIEELGIPTTYVPARNTIMLSIALSLAETIEAGEIWCGVNAVDYSGYPDCRPEFIKAFNSLIQVATKAGAQGQLIEVVAPLMSMSKAQIIKRGYALGVDYSKTTTCYRADRLGSACGQCDACTLRRRGFLESGIEDPTRYQAQIPRFQ